MAETRSTSTEATPPSEHGAGFPPFQKETFASQLLWLALFFVALYVIASRLALPRVGSILAERRSRIAADFAAAGRMKDEADAAIATYVRIPTIATTRSDGSRPPVPIDRDHCGAEHKGAVRDIC
jgi:F-type H+-transporting ATPase subunit b